MLILGIESSCDETGVALYQLDAKSVDQPASGLLAHALHSQIDLHAEYGGVVPELASRDHIRRLVPLYRQVLKQAGKQAEQIDAIAYTAGPGLAGALLTGAAFANALAQGLNKPTLPIHHLEGHLLSPLLSDTPPSFPFVALLVSGGHTQLMRVEGVGQYELLGETLDDAAGEAFDKTAKLLGLGYPGGPQLAALAKQGTAGRFTLPRPMLHSGDLDFSFAGLKTAVLTHVNRGIQDNDKADLAVDFEMAVADVLCTKAMSALRQTGLKQLVVAGGVGANQRLRETLNAQAQRRKSQVFYPELALCTDNGAMIAFAGALRAHSHPEQLQASGSFGVKPRWPLMEHSA